MPNRPSVATGLLLVAGALAGSAPEASAQADTVRLLLRYDHQFQFAGYYVALWDGLYRERGLHVEIEPSLTDDGALIEVGPALARGEAEFGILGADALPHLARGEPLRLLAPVFQQSAVAAFFHPPQAAERPRDLVGLSIAAPQSETTAAEIMSMFVADGVRPWQVRFDPYPRPDAPVADYFEAFVDEEFQVFLGHDLSVAWAARQGGLEVASLDPSDFGVDFYGDALFAHAPLVEARPDLVEDFLAASLEGWRRALADPDPVADRIARDLPRTVPVEDPVAYNRFLVPRVRDLVLAEVVPLGTHDPARWERMAASLEAVALLERPAGFTVERFDPVGDRARRGEARRELALRASLVLVPLLVLASLAMAWSRRTERRRRVRMEADLFRMARLESIGRITAGLAHDFNNMMTVVAGHADLIRTDPDRADVPEEAEAILDAVENTRVLVRRMLSFAGEGPAQVQRIGVSTHLGRVGHLLSRAAAPDAALHLELDDSDPAIEVDPGQLTQVVLNLVLNARDVSPPDGRITLRTRRTDPPTAADGERNGRYVVIEVEDEGPGVRPEIREWIFEPFFSTKGAEGSGLGLSTSRGFVREAGGFIDLESAPGTGSIFRLHFPVVD